MPFPPQHLAHVLEKEKEPKTKMFEDDEWILSLTRADATIADSLEGQLTSAASNGAAQDQDVYLSPPKGATHSNWRTRAKVCVKTALGAQ